MRLFGACDVDGGGCCCCSAAGAAADADAAPSGSCSKWELARELEREKKRERKRTRICEKKRGRKVRDRESERLEEGKER